MRPIILILCMILATPACAAPLPEPLLRWSPQPDYRLIPPPDGVDQSEPAPEDGVGPTPWPAPRLFGQTASEVAEDLLAGHPTPQGPFSVELWLNDHVNHPVGAQLVGVDETGRPRWTLGYYSALGDDKFAHGASLRFGPVSRTPARDDDGSLAGWRKYLHHLVGSFDGTVWRLYHDGVLVGESNAVTVSGGRLDLAVYLGAEPHMRLANLVRSVRYYDRALDSAQIGALFASRQAEIDQALRGDMATLHFTAGPYLNPPSPDAQGLLFETDRPARADVRWGETASDSHLETLAALDRLHRFSFTGLKPDTAYFYRVSAHSEDGQTVDSGWLSFRSMPPPGSPLVVAVTADTQERPFVNFRLSQGIWRQRPHLLLLAGDLIGGEEDERRWHWTDEYFVGMGPLVALVPTLAARGNGDVDMVDAATDRRLFTNFSRYHNEPGGIGYYRQRIGDVEFFFLDGNLALRERQGPGFRARQRSWLEQALRGSTAPWKIAIHHQPPFSSDEDDYGDSYRGPTSGGDPLLRQDFVDLYERFGVDLVISGHIHSYERSWPLLRGRPDPKGVTYLQVGGGGGDHERAGPTHLPTANSLYDGFHFAMIRLFAGRMRIQLFDDEERLRDDVTLTPRPKRK